MPELFTCYGARPVPHATPGTGMVWGRPGPPLSGMAKAGVGTVPTGWLAVFFWFPARAARDAPVAAALRARLRRRARHPPRLTGFLGDAG